MNGHLNLLPPNRTDRIRAAVVGAGMSDAFDAALEARSAVRWPERLDQGASILVLRGSDRLNRYVRDEASLPNLDPRGR